MTNDPVERAILSSAMGDEDMAQEMRLRAWQAMQKRPSPWVGISAAKRARIDELRRRGAQKRTAVLVEYKDDIDGD